MTIYQMQHSRQAKSGSQLKSTATITHAHSSHCNIQHTVVYLSCKCCPPCCHTSYLKTIAVNCCCCSCGFSQVPPPSQHPPVVYSTFAWEEGCYRHSSTPSEQLLAYSYSYLSFRGCWLSTQGGGRCSGGVMVSCLPPWCWSLSRST